MTTGNKKIFVVAGAAGGIGLEVVRQLPAGSRILAVVQNDEQAAQIASLVEQAYVCDLADSSSVESTAAAIASACGGHLDGVVFCAAVQPVGPVELVRRADLEAVFAINLFGSMQLVQGLIPALRRARGRIVMFSSMAGRVSSPMLGAYAATKYALEAMADALRRELRSCGISVSLVEPGGVDTPMAASQTALVNRAIAGLSGEDLDRYGRYYRGYLAMAQKGLRFASSPARVAATAVAAVSGTASPRARYIAGNDAKLIIALGRWLPWCWFDALLMKMTLGKEK
ncbi:MAG: SDR family NAD(P)-dependent oxidoreductase [Porticoccaceae bacterium]